MAAAYEINDPTVDSQVVNLKSSGAEALLVAGTPKFAAQAIRKASEIGWKPTILLNYPSSSVGATLKPAGLDKSTGVIVGTITMDPTDAQWDNNEGMKNFRTFVDKYMPGIDIADTNYLFGYTQAMLLEQLIKQCGNDLSRENIIKQARNLKDVVLPTVLPGIRINTVGQDQHELYPDAAAALDRHALGPVQRRPRRRIRVNAAKRRRQQQKRAP